MKACASALVLCPLTGYKEEFVKETDIAPKRHLAFVIATPMS
jgi:hypothetical protein